MAEPQEVPQIVGLLQNNTASIIPDTVSPLDAAVLRESPVLPPIDYTNLDFSSIKLQLVNLIKANASMFGQSPMDFSDSNTTGMLLNAMSYMGQMLSYHTDSMVNELFLDTAQSSWAVSKLLNMYAYKMARPLTGVILITATRMPASNPADDSKTIVVSPANNRYTFSVNDERYEVFPAIEVDGVLQPDMGSDFIIPAYAATAPNAVDDTIDGVVKNTYVCFALSGTTVTESFKSSGNSDQTIQLARGHVNDSDIRVTVDNELWSSVQHLSLAYMGSVDAVNASASSPFLSIPLECDSEFLTRIAAMTNTVGMPVAIDYNDRVVFADYTKFSDLHVPYRVGILANTPSKSTKAEVILYHPKYMWNTAGPTSYSSNVVLSTANTPIEWTPGEVLYLVKQATVLINGVKVAQPMIVSDLQIAQANAAYIDLAFLNAHPESRVAVGRALSKNTMAFGMSAEVPSFISPDKVFEPSWDGDFNLRVRFGNGIFGAIPAKGSVITVQYRVNDLAGVGAEVSAYDVSKVIKSGTAEVVLSNSAAGAPSNLGESPDIARQMVHRHFAAQDRIVSGQDYVVMSKRHNPNLKCTAVVPDTAGDQNVVILYALAVHNETYFDLLTDLEKFRLRRFLQQYMCMGVSLEVADGIFRNLDLKVDIRVRSGINPGQIRKDVENAIKTVFDPIRLEMGVGVRASAIDAVLMGIPGINSVDVSAGDAVYTSNSISNVRTHYPFQAIPSYGSSAAYSGPDIYKPLQAHEVLYLSSVTVNVVN